MKRRQDYPMDEALRQKLRNHASPVPEDMWDRIQAGRRQNRVHPWGWGMFTAAVLVVAGVSLWFALGRDRDVRLERQVMAQAEAQASSTPNRATTGAVSALSDEMTDLAVRTKDEARAEAGRTGRETSHTETEEAAVHRPSSRKPDGQRSRLTAGSAEVSVSGARQSTKQDRRGTLHDQDQPSGQEIGKSVDLASTAEQDGSGSNADPVRKPEVLEMDYRFARAEALKEKSGAGARKSGTVRLPGSSLTRRKQAFPSCYRFNSFLRGLSVDAWMAPEYASRQLVYKDPSMIEYAEQRQNDESYVFAYSLGFRANAHFRGGLALRTGLVYTDIAERLEYYDEHAQVTKVINVTLDTLYQNGNIVYVWDTLSVTEYGSYTKTGYNRYRFYDVPLIVGYEIDRGPWVIHLNTGILFNIATSQRGDFLDPEHQLVNFDSDNADAYRAFRRRVGSSLMMSLGFNYAFLPRTHLLVEPQLRVWLQPLNVQSYPIDQKYVNLGLAMGIRQYF